MAKKPVVIEDFGEKIGGARKDRAEQRAAKGIKNKKTADTRPAWQRRYDIGEVVAGDKVGKFVVHDTKKKTWYGQHREVGTFNTREEAERAIPLAALSETHKVSYSGENQYTIVRKTTKGYTTVAGGQKFAKREDALAYMAQNAIDMLSERPKQGFGENLLRQVKITHKDRVGPAVRSGDVAPEAFLKTFGARGVEFGHWEEGARRQGLINTAYDSLFDLARVTGLKPNQVTLGGQLGVSFGARGHGGQNSGAATYHPDYGTMNFTKPHGAGALGHEWFHALDHAMGRLDDPELNVKRTNASGDQVWNTAGDMSFASERVAGTARVRALHEEVRAAYADLVKSMRTKDVANVEDPQTLRPIVEKRATDVSAALDRMRKSLTEEISYRSRGNKPATPEQLAKFDKVAEKIRSGNVAAPEWKFVGDPNAPVGRGNLTHRWTSPEVEQLASVMKEVRGRSGFDNQNRQGPMDEVARSMVNRAEMAQRLADAEAGKAISSTTKTNFYLEAAKLDQTRTTPYWTFRHEMFARAGETWLFDKMEANKLASPYLVSGAQNSFEAALAAITGGMEGTPKPFPEGDERALINSKFDRLFEAIQKHGLVTEAPNTEPVKGYTPITWPEGSAKSNEIKAAAANEIHSAMKAAPTNEVGPGIKTGWSDAAREKSAEARKAEPAPEPMVPKSVSAPSTEVRKNGKRFEVYEDGKPIKDSKGADKWFGTKEKADAFLAGRGSPKPAKVYSQDTNPAVSKPTARAVVAGDNGAPADSQLRAAKRLEDVAKRTIEEAQKVHDQPRLMNTARRARMGSGVMEEQQRKIANAKTALRIAEALREGTASPELAKVQSLADVERLTTAHRQAMYNNKAKREQHRGSMVGVEPDASDLAHAKPQAFVRANVSQSDLDLLKGALKNKGVSKDLARLQKNLDRGGDHTWRLDDAKDIEALNNVAKAVKSIKDSKNTSWAEYKWQPKNIQSNANRWLAEIRDYEAEKRLGLTQPESLRSMLSAYAEVRVNRPKANPVRAAELDLVGRKLPGFFPTPDSLAKRMAEIADIKAGMKVLEPSAGTGRLADVAKGMGANVDAVEMQSVLRDVLVKKGHNIVDHDFTSMALEPKYDRVLMNPPFEKGQDMAHVQRAYDMLKPGGKMVAIMGEGAFYRGDKQAEGFRVWLNGVGGTSEKLPEGTFKESNTGVNTRLVTITKPGEVAQAALTAASNAGWSDAAREASAEVRKSTAKPSSALERALAKSEERAGAKTPVSTLTAPSVKAFAHGKSRAKKALGILGPVAVGAAMLAAANDAKAAGISETVEAGKAGAVAGGAMVAFTGATALAVKGVMRAGVSAIKAVPIVNGVMIAGGAIHGALTAEPGHRLAGAAKGAWGMSLPGMVVNTAKDVTHAVADRVAMENAQKAKFASANATYTAMKSAKQSTTTLRGFQNPNNLAAALAAQGKELGK